MSRDPSSAGVRSRQEPADLVRIKPRPAISDHELIRSIGEGAYGEVWLARNLLGGYRAVKVVFRASFKTGEPYEREFRGIQRFEPISRTGEGLVDILQVGRNDVEGYFYYVMELADPEEGLSEEDGRKNRVGTTVPAPISPFRLRPSDLDDYAPRTLAGEIRRQGRLPPEECVQLGMNLSRALGHLHRHGLIHRDIKPANIIFVAGFPKLADIGLVTDRSDAHSFVGTEGFIPPEGPNSPQADIYGLGKVLYEISMGRDRKDFPEPATQLGEGPDSRALEELNAVILKACAGQASERYATAEDLHADLALLHSGSSVRWKRTVERRLGWARKAAGLAAMLAVLALLAFILQSRQTREARRNLYAANMSLAQRDWDKANPARLARLLSETESYPDKGFEWYFWQRQLHQDLRTFRGHTGAVFSTGFSPDGARLVSGGEDGTARVWDAATGRPLLQVRSGRGPLRSVSFSRDGRKILTASQHGTVTLWDADDGGEVLSLSNPPEMCFAAALSPDAREIVTVGRVSGGSMHLTVQLWDAETGAPRRVLEALSPGGGTSAVSYSRDGSRVAAITEGMRVKVWECATGRELVSIPSDNYFYSVAMSPDGRQLVTGAGKAEVWNVETGRRVLALEGDYMLHVHSASYSTDGRTIATGSGDQRVILWDAETGREKLRLTGHRAAITQVAFSPGGQRLGSASLDGTVKLWDARALTNPRTLPHPSAEIHMLVLSPDGRRAATGMWDKTVRITDLATGQVLLVLDRHADEVLSLAFSPDGRRLATGNGSYATRSGRDRARIWDSVTGEELLVLPGDGFVAFSPDGRRIATSRGARAATLWDAVSGKEQITLAGHTGWVAFGAFSPDGKRFATASQDRTVKLWDARTGELQITIDPGDSPGTPATLAFSPDGRRLAISDWTATPRICDAATGKELFTLEGHTDAVTSVGFAPDSARLVTASQDFSAKVWDASNGRELLTLESHRRMVKTAVFTPEGHRIITAGLDGLIKIWETATPGQVARWKREETAAATRQSAAAKR